MLDKAALRKQMRTARSAMPEGEAAERSTAAQRHVLATSQWLEAASVGLYVAVRNETGTSLLLESAWDAAKDVYLPYTVPIFPGVMHFLPCARGQALVTSGYGIPEPSPDASPLPPGGEWVPQLIIVPGLAYDYEGHRLGSGGGYYDRLFAKDSMQDVIRIGLAYAFQVVSHLPAEEWDAPVHAIATEEGIIWL